MAHTPPQTSGSSDTDSLTDRVAARVIDARLALEQRQGQAHSKSRRAKSAKPISASPANGEGHETESLQRVFRAMGVSYRRYRRQAGGPVVPGLRDAAYRFRADPSLQSLVAVAAYLDELDLLS